MRRRTLALLLLLASTGAACETGYGSEGYRRESGGVSPGLTSATAPLPPPAPPGPPPPPPPTGGFGPIQVTPQPELVAFTASSGGSAGRGADCWAAPVLTEYTLAKDGGKPLKVAAAPDGSLWFSDAGTTSVARLQPSGAVTRYALPAGRTPGSLVVARDGAVWFTTVGPAVARLTPDGELVAHAVPESQPYTIGGTGDVHPAELTAGPDGAVWFLEIAADRLGRITKEGAFTDHPLPDRDRVHTNPQGLAVGPDGALWFTETLKQHIGRIDPKTRAITEFPVPPGPNGSGSSSLTLGPDGALWFEGGGPDLGRMTTAGAVTWFALPGAGQVRTSSITSGPDGRLWVIDGRGGQVLRMTPRGAASELPPVADPTGLHQASLEQMTATRDAVWFAEPALNRIGRYACTGEIRPG